MDYSHLVVAKAFGLQRVCDCVCACVCVCVGGGRLGNDENVLISEMLAGTVCHAHFLRL